MKYERPLSFSILLKGVEGNTVIYNDLKIRTEAAEDSGSDSDGAGGSAQIPLKNCFSGYSSEEMLGGDDQWYCNKCKEHRDINKKLEIYSAPKILVI